MSKNIQELREALERQTKETLKLQEEATKFTMESITHSLSHEETLSSGNIPSGGAASPLFGNQNVLASSIRSTVMETSTSASAGSSPPKTVLYSKYEVDIDTQKRNTSYPGKEHIESILEEYSQQVRDLQKRLNDNTELHEQQKFNLRQTIVDLQTKLQEVQTERDALVDIRRRESQSQEDIKIQLQATVHELETANHLQEEMLREANSQTEHLKKMVHGHEEVLHELRGVLVDYEDSTGKRVYEHENISGLHIRNLGTAFSKVLRDLDSDVSYFKGRIFPLEEQLESLKKESQAKTELLLQQHQDRIEQLINEHEQEVAALTDKTNSARSHANSIQSQMEIIQEQTRNQNSMYMRQVSQLESTVSQLRSELREAKRMYEDKIEDLEKQLHLAHSEMAEAQTERDQYSQESGNLDDQLQQLLADLHKKEMELSLEKEQNKRLWDRDTGNSITIDHLRRELDNKNMELQRMENIVKTMKTECQGQMERQMAAIKEKNESIERVSSLTAQLESTKEMLRKVVEDLTAKKINLEASERTVSDLTACLQEKERAIEITNEEIKKLRSRVDSKLQELQHLKNEGDYLQNVQSERETLKLQVMEKERVIEIFQKQIDTMTQIVGQHGRTAGAMEVEKSQLVKEISDRKLEVQELKIVMDKKEDRIREMEARLSELELEKVKLINTCTERLCAVKDMKLERDQLMNELKASRTELAGLAEEYEKLKRNYRDKSEEMEGITSKLRKQLKSAQAELEQTRATLKTMEGSDGHAMKVAMGMQKQITAKRGQIDALQSKIKFLEEAMTNATKEKHYLKEEKNKLSQELSCIATENNKMTGELEILRSQDRRLKEKIANMEAALDKASMQFAECQCIIQCQEQEAMRFKLQHTLDVKELQGPGYTSGSTSGKPRHISLPLTHPHSNVPSSQASPGFIPHMPPKPAIVKEDPLRDLKRLLQELRNTIDEIPSMVLSKNDSDGRRELSLATLRNTMDAASREPAVTCSLRQDIYSKDTSVRDSAPEGGLGQDTFSREPLTLHVSDLEDQTVTLSFTPPASPSIFTAAPRYASSPKKFSQEERYKDRSPVHSLLTAPLDDLKAVPSTSADHRPSLRKSSSPEATTARKNVSFIPSSSSQPVETSGSTCRKLQNKMENLQNLVETLQMKNQAMSSMIRCQEKKIEKVKDKEKKLTK
ncbi:coiled-coil domain-containing protein 158 isoform X1 [Caretta caretta]|uniref:coiled-coil domain-containing protein 158 isoform X1 n=2 Tax=Caretta caretta TaxID=8467 RepID=UPI0020942450|nr:coiled-coil domain-containing protein 158 isoform X2 [Caretta caretta]XP_048703179.1 coiled-coil domain-containing protein 158 isoform X2 [Caretta caretta]